tara:strand:- start:290 stop:625 length:336 start_codon:yes stop_codon:yes gene_type:complete
MAAIANLRIDQGANFSSDVTVTNSDGNVVDLTGYTTEAKMALSYGATDTVTITSALADDPTTGVVELTLTDTQTGALEAPARYVYDVYITQTSTSTVTRVIEGIITVNPRV